MKQLTHIEPSTYIDRELSWLDFNQRVLDLAEDSDLPLLERVRFMAIVSSNLDDFFMIRAASVKLKVESGISSTNLSGFTPVQLFEEILEKSKSLVKRQNDIWHSSLLPELSHQDIHIIKWHDLTTSERDYVKQLFDVSIFPVLTPLAVDPSRPFPYISGLSISLAVLVRNPESDEEFFARVKVPNTLPRFVVVNKEINSRFITLEEVIAAHLEELFPGMIIEDYFAFRLTRNEDLDLEEEESDNLLETMELELQRRKFGPPVRLEVEDDIKTELLERLIAELEITRREVFKNRGPLDFTGLHFIADLERPALKYEPFRGVLPHPFPGLEEAEAPEFFQAIRDGEVLLHHPYDSFTSTVVRFLETAAIDPNVLAIKQTLYRTSGDSPIIEALLEAAAAGKQVLAVIEIRARFDELANVRWARKLEEAGVHVVYGLMGLKTHAKLSLVVRKENGHLQRYCHVGTGNYNPKTARLYEDFGLLSADPRLCEDLSRLFNQLSGFVREESFERLLVAPRGLRKGLLERINREIENAKAGKPARIRLKLNALLDEEFVDALYEASQNGVEIEANVRGICSLKPGLAGKSETIVVRSFLGRFLEHSRIIHFHNDGNDEFWIGSADLMDRNLNRRIEALVRVESIEHKARLSAILDLYADPHVSHWQMRSSGAWERKHLGQEGRLQDLHEILLRQARSRD
ncbi:MAG: RNA degradosome polyphosphate kinase [Candidatus Nanopelagicaceae bacterium]|nr:RNA degradosome polyphosphate kinase [Candidatus Nanopelagicaceae bacterium]